MVWGPGEQGLVPRTTRSKSQRRQESVVKARYGAGMLLGCLAVHWTKKVIRAIPLVGVLTAPVLELLPTIVVGPAIGAAVVYGLDEGDVYAARHKVQYFVREASREVEGVIRDVRDEVEDLQRRSTRAGRGSSSTASLLPVLDDTVTGMERQVVPVLERQYKAVKRHVETAHRELTARNALQEAAAGRGGSGW